MSTREDEYTEVTVSCAAWPYGEKHEFTSWDEAVGFARRVICAFRSLCGSPPQESTGKRFAHAWVESDGRARAFVVDGHAHDVPPSSWELLGPIEGY